MPIYETLTILHPELPETRIKEICTWMQGIVENGEGKILQVDEWGMRNLAYRIQKQKRGYYVRLEYDASPAALKELERNFRLSEDVMRFLSIVRDAPSEKRPVVPPPEIRADIPNNADVAEAASETPTETPVAESATALETTPETLAETPQDDAPAPQPEAVETQSVAAPATDE
jgi:small subunit ribosomal protein S6